MMYGLNYPGGVDDPNGKDVRRGIMSPHKEFKTKVNVKSLNSNPAYLVAQSDCGEHFAKEFDGAGREIKKKPRHF